MTFTNTSAVDYKTGAFVTMDFARTFQSICSMNQMGVSYFNQGKYSDAILCFQGATSTLKSLSIEEVLENHEEQTTSRCCVSTLVMTLPAKQNTPPPASVGEAQIANDVTSVDRKIFSRPFEIMAMAKHFNDSKHEEQVLVNEQVLVFKLSIVLIFNLAMSHHVLAIVLMMGDSQSSTTYTTIEDTVSVPRNLLLKACSLYSLSYLIPPNDPNLGMIWPGMMSLYVKAILNNLGHCYASLDNTKSSVQCFEQLLKTIMLVQQDHIYQRLCEENNRCQNDMTMCFWDSILFLIMKNPGFAPAA
jgi:Tetratricopeptide repeat